MVGACWDSAFSCVPVRAIAGAGTASRFCRGAEDGDHAVGDLDGTESMLGSVLDSPPERMSAGTCAGSPLSAGS